MEQIGFYEEIGKNYRFFLSWRYGVFAAYFVLLYGAFNLAQSTLSADIKVSGLILIIASIISFFLWIADCRTRVIYRNLLRSGSKIEKKNKGAYSTLNDIKLSNTFIFSQSMAINGLFSISFFIFFFIGFILLTANFKYTISTSLLKQIDENIKCSNVVCGILSPLIILNILLIIKEIYFNRFYKKDKK